MIANKKLRAFIPTVMAAKAKSFYKDILELTLLSEDNYALQFEANGVLLRVATVPQLTPHPFTVLDWMVDDIFLAIQSLRKKGVVFEKYDFLQQDDTGVWIAPGGTKVAWFKDPDGNLLSLTE